MRKGFEVEMYLVSPRNGKETCEATKEEISQQDWVGLVMTLWHFDFCSE